MLVPPCLRLHAGGSDHLSRVVVTIPRVELGGIFGGAQREVSTFLVLTLPVDLSFSHYTQLVP